MKWLNRINQALGKAVSWLSLVMVGMTFVSVIQRYLFQSNAIWQQELVIYAHALMFLGAAGYTLQMDEQVRVDILYARASERYKAWVDLLGTLIFLFPFCIALSWYAYDFISQSWDIYERSREHDGLPGVYLLKTAIWVFTGSLMLQGIVIIRQALLILSRKRYG
ncbi:MAG: TRAP transporter small permease subunit [Rickettsiales bacterium]|nr:TRAP transporter small permease subunit [Rickettsiales bacterium]